MRLVATCTLLVPLAAAGSLRAQTSQNVPLGVFESEAQVEQFLVQQAQNRLVQLSRSARNRGCNATARYQPGVQQCLGVQSGDELLDDTSLMVSAASRHLLMIDSSLHTLRAGSGVQLSGDDLFVVRRGRLARIRLSGNSPRVSAEASTRATSDDHDSWNHEWNDELHAWGNIVASFVHNRGAAFPELRTHVMQRDGRLTPRDTLLLSGDPPVPLDNVATRVIGSHLFVYSAWQVTTGDEALAHLVSISHMDSDGNPDASRPFALSVSGSLRRVSVLSRTFRPVTSFGSSTILDHVHALVDCNLATAPLSCSTTMVLAPRTRSFDFTRDALEIVAAESDSALVVRIPYDNAPPTASLRIFPYAASPASVNRSVRLDNRLLVLSPGQAVMRAALRNGDDSSRVLSELVLPNASPDSAVDVNFSNPVLTVHAIKAPAQYRVAYTVLDRAAERSSNPQRANNAVWLFDVVGDALVNIGVLRASPGTFADADESIMRQRLGVTQAVISGDRVFAVFDDELVEARVLNGQLVEVGRTMLYPQ